MTLKNKPLFILGAIFLVLMAVNAFQKMHGAGPSVHEVHREEWHPLVSEEKVSRILFSRPGYTGVDLIRKNSEWKVETLSGVNADSLKIKNLINQINQLKAELRAEGGDFYERFGLTDQKAFRIQILDASGTAILDFFMGSHRAGKEIFIRLPGKSKIYSAAEDLPALFGLFAELEQAAPQPIFFADLRLVPESFEQIQRFEIAEFRGGKKVTRAALERPSLEPGTPWRFVSGQWKFSVGYEKVEDYLARLTGTHAENIVMKVPAFKSEMEIMVRDERGKVLRLQFSPLRAGPQAAWLVKRENAAPVYEISEAVFKDLKSEDPLFSAENPLGLDLNDSHTVELIHDGRTETFSKKSGWASAAAILDAAIRIRFLSTVPDLSAKDLAVLPPTHILRITAPGKPAVEIKFYAADPQAAEMRAVITGYDPVFMVGREFFEEIFVPSTPPAEPKPVV